MFQTLGQHNYFVYILTNKSKTVLYIGFTTDLKDRLHFHQNPEAHSKSFTARYKCFNLIYWEHYTEVQTAIDRENQLKKWSRSKKDDLINKVNPDWRFLNEEI
ncbi:GIY-YIG nuclease family protein [Flavobacterium sp. ST-75]|uniref:GIY-YIG nuclease family protein n=1 Tax=Flavobacterium rhizophilum TaxID=3163296 RepID=A0ABW8YG24_9FLAO